MSKHEASRLSMSINLAGKTESSFTGKRREQSTDHITTVWYSE